MKPILPKQSPGFGLASVLLIIAMGGILAAICATSLTKVSKISMATGYLIEKTKNLDKNCVRPVGKVDRTAVVL
jgi:flagellar motor component MotA